MDRLTVSGDSIPRASTCGKKCGVDHWGETSCSSLRQRVAAGVWGRCKPSDGVREPSAFPTPCKNGGRAHIFVELIIILPGHELYIFC